MNLASYQVKSCVEKKWTIIYQAGEWEEHSSCFLPELWGQAPHYLPLRFSGGKHEGREQSLLFFTLIKRKIKFSSYIYKEIQNGAVAKSYMANGLLNPHIWLNICAFPHSSYINDFATAPF